MSLQYVLAQNVASSGTGSLANRRNIHHFSQISPISCECGGFIFTVQPKVYQL